MNSNQNHEARPVQFSGAGRPKCPVCGDTIGETCFCKIYVKEQSPILLCCPWCVVKYIESARPPTDLLEQELRDREKTFHFFIGENKPWS